MSGFHSGATENRVRGKETPCRKVQKYQSTSARKDSSQHPNGMIRGKERIRGAVSLGKGRVLKKKNVRRARSPKKPL